MGRHGIFLYPLSVILGLLAAMACAAETPELVPTAEPTATASPTKTAPAPTQTPQPTIAPASTQRPTPTATPQPTPTPKLITIDCNDERFTEEIIKLSEENKNQFAPRILKLYSGAEELERTKRVLRCRGEALLSRGGESYITYHYEIDRDGDAFIGYQIGDAISTPTPTTMSTPIPAPRSTQTPTRQPQASKVGDTVPTATLEPTTMPEVGFGPGTYRVGSDIQPGTYAGKAGTNILDSCYWARLSGVSGASSDILANDIKRPILCRGYGHRQISRNRLPHRPTRCMAHSRRAAIQNRAWHIPSRPRCHPGNIPWRSRD